MGYKEKLMSSVKEQDLQDSMLMKVSRLEIDQLRLYLGQKLKCNIYYGGALIGAAGTDISTPFVERLEGLEPELLRFTNLPEFPNWEPLPAVVAMA